MSASELARALAGIRKISLDTSVFLAAGDARDPRQECALWLLRAIGEGRLSCTISVLGASELLVRALEGGAEPATVLQGLLRTYPNIEVAPLTLDSAVLIAAVRARTRLRAPDACVVATAIDARVDGLVHGDRDFSKAAEHYRDLRFIYLGDYCQ